MIWNFPLVLQRPVKPSILLIDYWHFYYFSINLLKRLLKMAQGSVLRIWGGLSLLQYYMGGKGRGELLKTLIWSIQFEHDDDDDQYWVNIKVWEAVQISGISRTESEKHEKRAIGSVDVAPCWSTFFGIVPFLHHHLWWDYVTWQIPTIIITDKNPPWWESVMVGICWVTMTLNEAWSKW